MWIDMVFAFVLKDVFYSSRGDLRGTMNDGLKCTVNGSGIMEEGWQRMRGLGKAHLLQGIRNTLSNTSIASLYIRTEY